MPHNKAVSKSLAKNRIHNITSHRWTSSNRVDIEHQMIHGSLRSICSGSGIMTFMYLSKSWSYKTELSPLVRYRGRPNLPISGASGFSLQTPCSLKDDMKIQIIILKFHHYHLYEDNGTGMRESTMKLLGQLGIQMSSWYELYLQAYPVIPAQWPNKQNHNIRAAQVFPSNKIFLRDRLTSK